MVKELREYRIIGAFDTETTNIGNAASDYQAFPVLYQLGSFEVDIKSITPDNCEELVGVEVFRTSEDLYNALDALIETCDDHVGVVLVHNLAFDMYALAPYLLERECRVLAKTARKPITITITGADGAPVLVFLDTLGLYMKSLARLGEECGMPKAVGDWDYLKIRTPETALTSEELNYARRDIYTLIAYTAYFLRMNPDIDPSDIGLKVMTKTGVVRSKRMSHLGGLKGKGLKRTVNQLWNYHNRMQMPSSDSELFTMHACTRGGFTFCAASHASKVFRESDKMAIVAYDATSQHPAQMASRLYPVDFTPATLEELAEAVNMISRVELQRVIEKWARPFPCAFNACFKFENLRPKAGSMYEAHGIYPLASARLKRFSTIDNQSFESLRETAASGGYSDYAEGHIVHFGKIESATYCELWLTELGLWEVFQAYDFDSIEPVGGYLTLNFRKPTDLSLLSVMRFYQAKNALKQSMHDGNATRLEGLFPDSFVAKMKAGKASESEIHDYYMLAKADLNALFGIEATNEYRRDFELTRNGIELVGVDGICNAPKNPKCWYQFGQRIVGWSRIAQHASMQLIEQYVDSIICGDTDSFKLYLRKDNISKVDYALDLMGKYIDNARHSVTSRIRARFPERYIDLKGLGYYVSEGSFAGFSASWNKSYIVYDGDRVRTTIAGVPTSRGEHSVDRYGDELLKMGASFEEVASTLIGYNVTFDYSLTKLNGRKHPQFGQFFGGYVTDYTGQTSYVFEPMALAIYPEPKTIGNTESVENFDNREIAIANNELVNQEPVLLHWGEDGIGAEL